MASYTLKEFERRTDGILTPKDPDAPTYVMEFQAQMDPNIYHRVAMEMASFAMMHKDCKIRGIIIFLHKGLDPKTKPWHYLTKCRENMLQIVYFDEYIKKLEQKQPNHPLVLVFKPLLEKDSNTLKQNSGKWYQKIKQSRLPDNAKQNFQDAFFRWLSARFPELTGEEIIQMTGEEIVQMIESLPRFEETRAYEFYSIIEKRGEERGEERGEKRGEIATLIKEIKRFKMMNKKGEIDDITFQKICEPIRKDLKKVTMEVREMIKRQKLETT